MKNTERTFSSRREEELNVIASSHNGHRNLLSILMDIEYAEEPIPPKDPEVGHIMKLLEAMNDEGQY